MAEIPEAPAALPTKAGAIDRCTVSIEALKTDQGAMDQKTPRNQIGEMLEFIDRTQRELEERGMELARFGQCIAAGPTEPPSWEAIDDTLSNLKRLADYRKGSVERLGSGIRGRAQRFAEQLRVDLAEFDIPPFRGDAANQWIADRLGQLALLTEAEVAAAGLDFVRERAARAGMAVPAPEQRMSLAEAVAWAKDATRGLTE
jgi:hypothetical protein